MNDMKGSVWFRLLCRLDRDGYCLIGSGGCGGSQRYQLIQVISKPALKSGERNEGNGKKERRDRKRGESKREREK
jgi:hypothetical protein